MHLATLVATLLAAAPALAIPPEDFGFPSAPNDTALGVTFNPGQPNQVIVSEAELLGPDVALQPPQVSVNATAYESIASYDGSYVLMMVDPDASTPQNPTSRWILHWMAANLTRSPSDGTLTNSTPAVVDYAHPMPPPNSDAHRYILYAFQQPSNFSVPPDFSGYSATNRSMFNVTNFISQAGLQQPAAAQFFYVRNMTGTPPDFTATAGGSYPGGNGGAITAGPGPMVTPMSSTMSGMMSSMTSSGASAAASTTAAAAKLDAMGLGAAVAAGAAGVAAFAL